jgi:membrane protein YqaA with SNARE-associated domain
MILGADMLRSIYDWVLRLAAGRFALPALALVAFIEATFPFVPPDVMLAPMVLARRERAWLYAGVCTAGSVLGGCMGYAVGHFARPLALALLTHTGHAAGLTQIQALYAKYGVAVILIKGFTPVPYMVVTLASGFLQFSLPLFIGASIITRGGRFFLEAALLQHPHAKAIIDRHLTLLAVIGVVAIVLLFVGLRILETHAGG